MAIYRHILVLPHPPKSLPPKNENRLPPKNYRRMALPPKHYHHTLVLPLPRNSLPLKNEKPPTAKKIPPYGITAQKKNAICDTAFWAFSDFLFFVFLVLWFFQIPFRYHYLSWHQLKCGILFDGSRWKRCERV